MDLDGNVLEVGDTRVPFTIQSISKLVSLILAIRDCGADHLFHEKEMCIRDSVLIEPSGVGKLSDIVRAVEDVKTDAPIEIEGRITVVDGKKAKMYMKNFGEFYKDQVASASTIVISRTQEMSGDKIEECVALLREENKEAELCIRDSVDTDYSDRPLEEQKIKKVTVDTMGTEYPEPEKA